jgi:hypothetical protein
MLSKERQMIDLAKRLQFEVVKSGSEYCLRRETGVSEPVVSGNLTLQEAEDFLNTWKLRGFHGG